MSSVKITAIKKRYDSNVPVSEFGMRKAEKVVAFHETIPEYAPTPLVRLSGLAKALGIGDIYVKDESKRFGLNAFKGLGGSHAVYHASRGQDGPLTFVTATDGNHGRGVAWAAARLGQEAYVFLPKGTALERLHNIQKLGAHAEITDMVYDDTVRYAAKLARENGWILVQDTSWDGYEEIPMHIMEGYITMGYEMVKQIGDVIPTHVFLQAGVGSMAGAMAAFLADYYGEQKPIITVVEPHGANCIYKTAEADDGCLHFCGEDMYSIMAGLCCGEPCPIAWDLLQECADYALSCADEAAANGMRVLSSPVEGDERIISGESGASTMGALIEILRDEANTSVRKQLKLDEKSVVFCISTEGATDQANYRDIVWYGKQV